MISLNLCQHYPLLTCLTRLIIVKMLFFSDQQLLENTIKYSLFVRIWYTSNIYAVFKTDGIVVMTQTPAVATVRGTAVSTSNCTAVLSDLMSTFNSRHTYHCDDSDTND